MENAEEERRSLPVMWLHSFLSVVLPVVRQAPKGRCREGQTSPENLSALPR